MAVNILSHISKTFLSVGLECMFLSSVAFKIELEIIYSFNKSHLINIFLLYYQCNTTQYNHYNNKQFEIFVLGTQVSVFSQFHPILAEFRLRLLSVLVWFSLIFSREAIWRNFFFVVSFIPFSFVLDRLNVIVRQRLIQMCHVYLNITRLVSIFDETFILFVFRPDKQVFDRVGNEAEETFDSIDRDRYLIDFIVLVIHGQIISAERGQKQGEKQIENLLQVKLLILIY